MNRWILKTGKMLVETKNHGRDLNNSPTAAALCLHGLCLQDFVTNLKYVCIKENIT